MAHFDKVAPITFAFSMYSFSTSLIFAFAFEDHFQSLVCASYQQMLLYMIKSFHEDLVVFLLNRVFLLPKIRSSFQLASTQVTFHDFVYVHAGYNRNEQFRQASIFFFSICFVTSLINTSTAALL